MLDISQTYFFLNVGPLSEEELLDFARRVFDEFDRAAARYLPQSIDDYELRLLVEEGSVKGRSKLRVAATRFFYVITGAGGLIAGVKELDWAAREIGSRVVEAAVKESGTPGNNLSSARRGTGVVGKLHKMFHDVEAKRLTPEEATLAAIDLLAASEDMPDAVLDEIHAAFEDVAAHPGQLDLELDVEEMEPDLPPPVPIPPRRRPDVPAIPHITVEIVKEGRRGKPKVQTRH